MLLSLSLLYPFLFVAASALPVSAAPELTGETFTKSIEHGLWFVEHYSPYCTHCKHFKPTWDKLVADAEKEYPQVNLATVNCVLQGDLCDKNGIGGYPSLFMYRDGQKVEEFRLHRELDILKAFLAKHIADSKPAAKETPPPPPPKQRPKPIVNLDGEVLSLSSDNFDKTLRLGPAFVKFFAPWCGHCKKLAPTWKQLARHLQGNVTVAEVNCEEHQGLCKTHNIQGYPTLVWFGKLDKPTDVLVHHEYNGGRKLELLRAFVEKANAAGVHVLEKDEDIQGHIEKEDVVYLLLHPSEGQDILESVREAAEPLLGTPPIFASSSPSLFTQFSIPKSVPWAIVAIKDHDISIPSSTFHGKPVSNSADLRTWLLTHRLPTSLELTQDTFQTVMNAPQEPLVVIAAVSEGPMKEKVQERLRDVGKKWRVRTEGSGIVNGREVVWTLMDKTRWGQWLKSMYDIQKSAVEEGFEDVKVIIADHSKLVYYDTDRTGSAIKISSSSSLFTAVEDASLDKLRHKNSENFVERLARKLNHKLTVLQDILVLHPVRSVFLAVGFIVVVVYIVFRLIDGSSGGEARRDVKNRNARLD